MAEAREDKKVTDKSDLIIELPRRHLLLKLKGSVTSYGLYHIKPKTKGKYEKDLEHVGYYGSIVAGLKGFLTHVPDKDLTGRVKIEEVYEYFHNIKNELNIDKLKEKDK